VADCLFCGIISGEVKGEVVYQDSSVVAFKDINPKAPVHLLIVPRKHIATLLDVEQKENGLIGDVLYTAAKLARDHGISEDGFRVVLNCGAGAGQSVFHIHFHLLGGRALRWPPG
jgi:histidine triad (HIT) family protein